VIFPCDPAHAVPPSGHTQQISREVRCTGVTVLKGVGIDTEFR
jgi:hypothetical protein